MSHFYKVDINKTEWEIPERYKNLTPIGSGAYGQVWLVNDFFYYLFLHFVWWCYSCRCYRSLLRMTVCAWFYCYIILETQT